MKALDAIRSRQPWLIMPEALDQFAIRAGAFAPDQLARKEDPVHPLLEIRDRVGIVRLHGPLIRRPSLVESWLFDAVDTEEASAAVAEAAAHDGADAILLDIDSPGGTAMGTAELAEAVADASRRKTVHAFSGGLMCSAAYWVASQADAIYASRSARVGSIGVIIPFLDASRAFERAGLKMEVFASGKFKSIGTPGVSLSPEQRELLRAEVAEVFEDFRAAVLARGRKIPDEAMEGQTFSARQAQRLNLAGTAKGREAVLARLRRTSSRGVDTKSRSDSTPSLPHPMKKPKKPRAKTSDRNDELATAQAELAAARTEIERLAAELASAGSEGLEGQEPTDAAKELSAARAEVERLSKQVADQKAALAASREELAGARTEIAQLDQQVAGLTEANADLAAREQDVEKRAALRAAQIAAESGSPVPARVTPAGELRPGQPPSCAADVWNRQFQRAR